MHSLSLQSVWLKGLDLVSLNLGHSVKAFADEILLKSPLTLLEVGVSLTNLYDRMPIPLDCISSVSKLKYLSTLPSSNFITVTNRIYPKTEPKRRFNQWSKKTALILDEWTNQSTGNHSCHLPIS